MATVAALVLALLFNLFPVDISSASFSMLALSIAILLFFAVALMFALMAMPLQQAEASLTPRVIEVVRGDRRLGLLLAGIVVYGFLSFAMAATGPVSTQFLMGWIIFTGIAFDLAMLLYYRLLGYLDPFSCIVLMTQTASREVTGDRDAELCNWLETLGDVSLRAIKSDSNALCLAGVDAMRTVLRAYLAANVGKLAGASADSDVHRRASYVLHYAFDRMAVLYDVAVEKRLLPMCSHLISTFAKVAVAMAQVDISLVPFPIFYIGTCGKKAVQHNLSDVGYKSALTLLEVGKRILTENDVTRTSLEKPYVSIIRQLEEVSKESFRQDKSTPLSRLSGPFQELKAIFQSERYAAHSDAPVIITELERVLGDFANLEIVLRTIPPIPEPVETEEGSQ